MIHFQALLLQAITLLIRSIKQWLCQGTGEQAGWVCPQRSRPVSGQAQGKAQVGKYSEFTLLPASLGGIAGDGENRWKYFGVDPGSRHRPDAANIPNGIFNWIIPPECRFSLYR
jgi:hypothetical protein